jgi:hypothetical protein
MSYIGRARAKKNRERKNENNYVVEELVEMKLTRGLDGDRGELIQKERSKIAQDF